VPQKGKEVTLTFASWNQIVLWLRMLDTFRPDRLTAGKSITKKRKHHEREEWLRRIGAFSTG